MNNLTFEEYWLASRHDPVYVILGVQGSGTNLLSRLLVRTYGFSVLRDHSLVFKTAARLGRQPTPAQVRKAFEYVHSHIFPSALDRKVRVDLIHPNEPFRGMTEAFERTALHDGAEFARFIYAYRAFSLGTRLMAIKSDDLWEHIDQLDGLLPNRRTLLLTRDFRDNLVSICGKHFGPVEPICAAAYVKRQFQLYEREYRRSGSLGYHVRFEALVEAPVDSLRDLGRYYGLMAQRDPRDVVAAFKFRPNKIGKFAALSTQERVWCEALLREELLRYRYPLEFAAVKPPGQLTWWRARVSDSIRRVPQKIRALSRRLAR